MRRSTDKAKFCCCTDQRKWPLPCKVDFSALFICKVASRDFRFKNQNIENNNKINTCKFRMRSYREFSSPLVQESLYQLLRKSHLVSNCLLEGPCISDGLMKASTFPHTTRMTQSRVCLWQRLLFIFLALTNMLTRRHTWSECYKIANFRDIYPPACELLCLRLHRFGVSLTLISKVMSIHFTRVSQIAPNYGQ